MLLTDTVTEVAVVFAAVGTHIKRTNAKAHDIVKAPAAATRSRAVVDTDKIVPTISTNDTSTVSLCTKTGCAGVQGDTRAAHPQGANAKGIRRSYANVLLGRSK
jgi:hypothetical protein